jgi:hypothetical protein
VAESGGQVASGRGWPGGANVPSSRPLALSDITGVRSRATHLVQRIAKDVSDAGPGRK